MEKRFYRAILTGVFEERKEKNYIKTQDFLNVLISFSGIKPEKKRKYGTLYGMEHQSVFGYGIKIHRYETIVNEKNLIKTLYENKFCLFIMIHF